MEQHDTTGPQKFQLVRFKHERDGGPVHRVVSVMHDGAVELNDMDGYFAPRLFSLADDIADIPPVRQHDGSLMPCPFCGGEAEYGEVGGDGLDFGGQFIQCTNALCGASSALIFPCGHEPKPLLAERWNRRKS